MTGLSRRLFLASVPAAGLLGACMTQDIRGATTKGAPLLLVDGPAMSRVPAAGFVVWDGKRIVASQSAGLASGLSADEVSAGVEPRALNIDTPFRTASISKTVVALTALALETKGELDLDAPITGALPQLAGVADDVTLRHLLAHVSGLEDPEQYWLAHPGNLTSFMVEAFGARRHEAGDYFQYCNLGYGIAATVMEATTRTRFDRLAETHVLQPLQLDAGFNWSGVSREKRMAGATLYRETPAGWQIQTDGHDTLNAAAPALLIEDGASLDTYTPGQNGTLFSPQGGLRISLLGLARMIHTLGSHSELSRPVWTLNADASNGLHDLGYFTAFGTGVHIHPAADSLWPGYELIGHHGEAYGLYAGAWHAPQSGLSFAYAVTGTPDRTPQRSSVHPALNEWTAPLVAAAFREAGLA